MNKINKNLILAPAILILIFGLFATPIAYAKTVILRSSGPFIPDIYHGPSDYYVNNGNYSDGSAGADNTGTGNTNPTAGLNPVPTISQISPIEAPANSEAVTVTITGSKFMQGSMARVNDEDRTTNYVRENESTTRIKSTVLTMVLTKDDLASGKPISITVFNPAPGGGTSNSIIFNDKAKGSNLAAGAIFGDNSFMPKSFIQWLLLLVLIFLGVVLWRKAYGKDKKYKEKPLKHA